MLRSLIYFLKLAIYWLLFFTLYRIIFILIYPGKIPDGKYSEALLTFLFGLRLDASTISYLIAIPLIIWAIQQFIKTNFLNRINHFYHLALISAITVVCISNIAMYGEWNALINYNMLFYFAAPAKMFPYLSALKLLCVVFGVAVIIAVFILIFRMMLLMVIPYSTTNMTRKLIVISLLFPIVFVIMRGGTQQTPINETFSCYSETKFIEHLSINPAWHLGRTTIVALNTKEEKSLIANP